MLIVVYSSVQSALANLETCTYTRDSFAKHLDVIQKAVDQLNLENYANLHLWAAEMNAKIEKIFLHRLSKAIAVWIETFTAAQSESVVRRPLTSDGQVQAQLYLPKLDQLVLEISMRNQVIYLEPPIEHARASWLEQLQSWLGIICSLPKIKASRYEMRLQSPQAASELTFSDLPSRCTDFLVQVYNSIESRVTEISEYVDIWLQYQSLWDLRSEQMHETLGEDLSKWLQLLLELRKNRSTFDTTEVSRTFGYATIDYEQIQAKVSAKFDQWQHEILITFAGKLGNRMREVYADIEKARKDLESHSLEASSTAQAVTFITTVQQCKRKVKAWVPEVDTFRAGQTTLTRQRYQYPSDWLHIDQIDNEWAILNDVLDRKSRLVQDQTDALRAKITAEDKVVSQKIADASVEWSEQKPISGNIPHDEASARLQVFDQRLTQLRDEWDMVSKAKEALDLPASPAPVLSGLLEEVQDFKSVWAALSTIWNSLNELRETNWTSVQPRKLRQSIEKLIAMTKDMPSRMRQYAAFEHVQTVLRQLLKVNPLLSDMRSDAVRERHWVKIFRTLKPSKRYSQLSMTLGDVWDLNLVASEAIIRDVIAQAQGEMALEEFLRQVRETWQNYSLDL
ncbi:hypothetical protein LTS18_010951, partial [Coniosporium uncinatum]